MEGRTRTKWIFFNVEKNMLRSGWRIGIYIVVLSFISLAAVYFSNMFFPRSVPAGDTAFCIAVILSSVVMVAVVERRPFYDFGLAIRRRFFIEWGQGLLMAAAMMTFIVMVFMLAGAIEVRATGLPAREIGRHLLNGIILFGVAGFSEELIFRGYLFQTFVEGTNRTIAVIVVSILFGAAHLANPNVSVFSLLNVMLAGVFLSLAYFKTRTLWFCTGLHIGWNYFQGTVYSMPVSGLTPADIGVFHTTLTGPTWLTGGAFGPEGGICATVILIAASAAIWYSPWIKEEKPSDGAVQAGPAGEGAENG